MNHSQYIGSYFIVMEKEKTDEQFIEDSISTPSEESNNNNNNNNNTSDMYTLDQAINALNNKEAKITKNKKIDDKNKIHHWQYLTALSILRYLQFVRGDNNTGNITKMNASCYVAFILYGNMVIKSYKAACIRKWSKYFLETGILPSFKQGLHAKIKSVILETEHQNLFKAYLRSLRDDERTPGRFQEDLNSTLLASINASRSKVSVETARRWMIFLGFTAGTIHKGYYTDNHNRKDVVNYRDNVFLPQMLLYESRLKLYNGDQMTEVTNPSLNNGDKQVVLITHDESTFYANDGNKIIWMEGGKKKMRPKSVGSSVMLSGFVCDCHGFMCDDVNRQQSYVQFKAGSNRDGWFNNDDLVKQLQGCFTLFERLHPDAQLLFAFDNSMSHHKRAPDGLDASLLPLKDNGKNAPKMKETEFMNDDGEMVMQQMQFENEQVMFRIVQYTFMHMYYALYTVYITPCIM